MSGVAKQTGQVRTGLLAKKVGMSRSFTDKGIDVPITLLEVKHCQVVSVKTEEKHGYNAVQLGIVNKAKNVSKPLRGMFGKLKVEPKEKLVEFRVSKDGLLPEGAKLSVTHFIQGQKVDVVGTTLGKGFAGAMKRWNFAGLEATHGVSVSHRSPGSTGQRQDPGRVFKGKKMPGHLGVERVTIQNLEIVLTDEANGLIGVKGAVPGAEGSYVLIKDAVKYSRPKEAPFPGAVVKAAANDAPAATEAPAATVEEKKE